MRTLCCISLTLAARIIGAFGLSISILTINMILSEFFSRSDDDKFLTTMETWALLGLNWTNFRKQFQKPKQVQVALTCFLGFFFLFLFASALLALGSVFRKPNYTTPWLYLQMTSIIDQTVGLCIHLINGPHYDVYDRPNWYIPLSSLYLLTAVYFWMIVYSARQEWYDHVPIYDNSYSNQSLEPPSYDYNMPKTPSYLSQITYLESTPPPIPIKYDIV